MPYARKKLTWILSLSATKLTEIRISSLIGATDWVIFAGALTLLIWTPHWNIRKFGHVVSVIISHGIRCDVEVTLLPEIIFLEK